MAAAQPVRAVEALAGAFYRSPKGHVVQVIDRAGDQKVCIRYRGLYGMGTRDAWIPGESPLVPAPELTDFPPS